MLTPPSISTPDENVSTDMADMANNAKSNLDLDQSVDYESPVTLVGTS